MTNATYLRAAGIGATCGLRSMTGPAIARWRAGGDGRTAALLMALGEMIADKTPIVPARTSPAPLLMRALAGGFAGAEVAGTDGGDRRIGALVGAAAAVAASYAGLALRRRLGARTGLPDPVVALVEDAVAVGGGLLATTGTSRN